MSLSRSEEQSSSVLSFGEPIDRACLVADSEIAQHHDASTVFTFH